MIKRISRAFYEKISEEVDYNPDTGVFKWKPSKSWVKKKDRIATSGSGNRYLDIVSTINGGRRYIKAHRLAWFMTYNELPECVDHIDGDILNNRLSNLRGCSTKENSMNHKRPKNNKSGICGVSYQSRDEAWVASISFNGKRKHLYYGVCPAIAVSERKKAEYKYFNKFRRVASCKELGEMK